jgi:membrane fusion protein, heavy metal efflux system
MNLHGVVVAGCVLTATLSLAACTNSPKPEATKTEAPATLTGAAVKESELTTITLTAEAEDRLGIRVEEARGGSIAQSRRFAGEITRPVGSNIVVSSPMAGTLQSISSDAPSIGSFVKRGQPLFSIKPFIPLTRDMAMSRDLIATAEGEVAQGRVRLENAQQRKARADRMIADQVGTARAQEEAQQEIALATTALRAAENRLKQSQGETIEGTTNVPVLASQDGVLRQIFVSPGQTVSAGLQLFEIEDIRAVWIRVPIYAGEVHTLAASGSVSVQAINGTGRTWIARPVNAPPSADSASSTVHLYYQLPNEDLRFKPGEKLMVTIRAVNTQNWIQVPWSAIVFDTIGGSWVFESLGERRYARRRVDLDHSESGIAYLRAGIAKGTKVVAEGAAELWGFEFGVRK